MWSRVLYGTRTQYAKALQIHHAQRPLAEQTALPSASPETITEMTRTPRATSTVPRRWQGSTSVVTEGRTRSWHSGISQPCNVQQACAFHALEVSRHCRDRRQVSPFLVTEDMRVGIFVWATNRANCGSLSVAGLEPRARGVRSGPDLYAVVWL